jgi:hypothetical protein
MLESPRLARQDLEDNRDKWPRYQRKNGFAHVPNQPISPTFIRTMLPNDQLAFNTKCRPVVHTLCIIEFAACPIDFNLAIALYAIRLCSA